MMAPLCHSSSRIVVYLYISLPRLALSSYIGIETIWGRLTIAHQQVLARINGKKILHMYNRTFRCHGWAFESKWEGVDGKRNKTHCLSCHSTVFTQRALYLHFTYTLLVLGLSTNPLINNNWFIVLYLQNNGNRAKKKKKEIDKNICLRKVIDRIIDVMWVWGGVDRKTVHIGYDKDFDYYGKVLEGFKQRSNILWLTF